MFKFENEAELVEMIKKQLMAGHVSSIPVDIVEGAIESIGALTSMDRMKAFSYISYRVGLGLTTFFL